MNGCVMVSKLAWMLLFCVPCAALGSDEPSRRPNNVVSVSASGDYRLRLVRASQAPSPWDKSIAAVSMDFQLEVTQPEPHCLPTQMPDNVFIEQADPLVSAHATPLELVSTNKHSAWTDNHWGHSVTIHNLEIGQPRTRLHSLELGVTLVQATDWEQYAFTVTRPGTNEVMRCGPLKIHLEGKDDRVFVSFTSFSRDEKERGEYAKRVPLAFPTIHSYGVSHASVTDSKKRELFCSTSGITGGSSFGMFVINQPISLHDPIAPKIEKLEYPLAVTVRFPKQYRQQRVTFDFRDIPLPPLQN